MDAEIRAALLIPEPTPRAPPEATALLCNYVLEAGLPQKAVRRANRTDENRSAHVGYFGLTTGAGGSGSPQLSGDTFSHPELARFLFAFVKWSLPGFQFTSVQVAINLEARPHRDSYNCGWAALLGAGDYSGGAVWLHNEFGPDPYWIAEDDAPPLVQPGAFAPGFDIDTNWK